MLPSEFDARQSGERACMQGQDCTRYHTNRLCSTAAAMKLANRGCGSKGRDFSSGWNCTPMNQGWSGSSMISGSRPSGDMPAEAHARLLEPLAIAAC